ncbi:MAG TPA: M48 family metallopeptidase [Blastocatellia bacterium]|nr:M48 family metallopeptidase [Blastocatellia bacterium]
MRRSLIVVSLSLICAAAIVASGANARTQSSTPAEPSSSSSGPVIEKEPVKSYSLPPEKYEKAVAYSRTQYTLHFVGVIYSLLLLLIILSMRIAPALRDWAERVSRRRIVQAIVFVPLLLLTFDALRFPLDVYQHHLAVHYDISVQGWSSWFWDWTKGELIQFVIASILAYILYGVIRRSRRRWWLYFGLASFPMLVFLLFISPVIIDPLFNRFEPLEATQPDLVAEIEKVVNHGGLDIPRQRMFEMKASEKVSTIDAYVTGFGASKRVVVWDTTIAKMTSPQTMFVVGHEMGHYVLGHISKGIAFAGALIIVGLLLVHFVINRTLARKQRRWALRGLDDWASLPAFLLFIYLFFFLAEPAFNTFSRYQEHQADVYGLEVTHGIISNSSATAAEAFQILGEVDLADPNPSTFIKVWLYSHPPLAERLKFAREYDPWSKGQPTMFVR